MFRHILGSAVGVVLLPVAAFAQQPPVSVASGVGGFGGGVRPNTPALSAPVGPQIVYPTAFYFPPRGFHRPPFYPGVGFGGGFYSPYYYPYGYGYGYDYGPSIQIINQPPAVIPVPTAPPEAPVELSGELPAKLTLEFPAPAEVWVNGKKADGEATDEWTLTTPSLRTGEQYSAKIRARWTLNGQTYEYTRDVTLTAGDRSRGTVISGTAVNDK